MFSQIDSSICDIQMSLCMRKHFIIAPEESNYEKADDSQPTEFECKNPNNLNFKSIKSPLE